MTETIHNQVAQNILTRHGIELEYAGDSPLEQLAWNMGDDGIPYVQALTEFADEVIRLNNAATVRKVWSAEDIKMVMTDFYPAISQTPGFIANVAANPYFKSLGDCTDDDWHMIRLAIQATQQEILNAAVSD